MDPSAVVQEKKARKKHLTVFLNALWKVNFQVPDLVYERFIIMPSDVEFNSKQSGVAVKSNNETV